MKLEPEESSSHVAEAQSVTIEKESKTKRKPLFSPKALQTLNRYIPYLLASSAGTLIWSQCMFVEIVGLAAYRGAIAGITAWIFGLRILIASRRNLKAAVVITHMLLLSQCLFLYLLLLRPDWSHDVHWIRSSVVWLYGFSSAAFIATWFVPKPKQIPAP